MAVDSNTILKTCCVCLNKTYDLMQLTTRKHYNTKSWISKLKNCVTKIDWSKDYLICHPCAEQLDSVYNFHQLCVHSDETRKKIVLEVTSRSIKTESNSIDEPKERLYHENNCNDFVAGYDASDVDDPQAQLCCKTCSLAFHNENDLKEHGKKIHIQKEQSGDDISKKHTKDKNTLPKQHQRRNGNAQNSNSSKTAPKKNGTYATRGRKRKVRKFENAVADIDVETVVDGDHLDIMPIVEEDCGTDQDPDFEPNDDRANSEDSDAVWDMKFPSIEKTEPKGNPDIPKLTFQCIVCKSMFNKCTKLIKHALAEHQMEKSDVKPYACTDCPKRYNDSARWKEHYLKYHKSLQNEMCIYCSKTFSSKRALNIHEKRHQNKREYQCPFCPKRFNTISGRLTHKFTVHTDPSKWKYVCDLCNKRFYTRSKLDTHIRRHNNDKPYGCHLCDKKFCDSSELQMHLPSHTNVRDFKCSQCDKEYKREKNLKMHMAKDHNVDNGIKVYVKKKNHCCHICPKAFYTKEKLMRHLCSHTGEKPFPCTVCDKRFTDKWYATQHMKTVHDFVQETDY